MKTILNFTPHAVNINGLTFESVGIARVNTTVDTIDRINGIEVVETEFGKVEGLPRTRDGVFYIVSRLVVQASPDRKDLLVPDGLVRDNEGNIIGYTRFSK